MKKFFLFILYLIAAFIPVSLYISNQIGIGNSNTSNLLAGSLGIIAYTIFASELLLTSRPKILDKYFSLDKMYRFHMTAAILALFLGLIHKLLKESLGFGDSFQTKLGNLSLLTFAFISAFGILFMINKLFFKINFMDKLRGFLRKIIPLKYQTKILIHDLAAIGLILLTIHILLAFSVSSYMPLKAIMLIYFLVPMCLFINNKFIKKYFNSSKKYTVTEVIEENDTTVTLRFTPQKDSIFNFKPGQFLYLKLYNPQIPHDEHPFTISSDPTTNNFISITAKKLGDFTDKLNKVNVGDTAYIDGPFGTFSYTLRQSNKKICFLAGGIGITPFLSMLRYIYSNNIQDEIILLWGVRNVSELICLDEIKEMASHLKNFKFIPVVSDEINYKGEKGFIDVEKIKKYCTSLNDFDFYICGPGPMLDIEIRNLKSLGINIKHIHYEKFTY